MEDFNLYKVDWQGTQFTLYEGNHPQNRKDTQPFRLPIDEAASLSFGEGRGSIVINVKEGWPAYLDVMGPCQSRQRCLLQTFAAKLTLR
ncbi:MAG TPA: hypothetical protein VGR19_05000 [Allosphingosinicella sp.]|nr:hypothetical protein [Allosphingosinicella sp.]